MPLPHQSSSADGSSSLSRQHLLVVSTDVSLLFDLQQYQGDEGYYESAADNNSSADDESVADNESAAEEPAAEHMEGPSTDVKERMSNVLLELHAVHFGSADSESADSESDSHALVRDPAVFLIGMACRQLHVQ